jgi:hypothetical protein
MAFLPEVFVLSNPKKLPGFAAASVRRQLFGDACATVVLTLAELSFGLGSNVLAPTVAVLVMVVPAPPLRSPEPPRRSGKVSELSRFVSFFFF